MGKMIINPGGGGTGSDECTATKAMVLAGYKAVTADSDDEAEEGTLDVQSILSFSAAPYSSKEIMFTWQNPTKGAFSGVIIVGKEGGYPTGITDGTRYYKGFGNNASAGGASSAVVDGFESGVTYYFRAFSYALKNDEEWLNDTYHVATAEIAKGQQTFTSSGTFTVPDGVRSVDVFLVGGGSSGPVHCSSISSSGYSYYGGAGSGYTKTITGISVNPGDAFDVVVGSGGAPTGVGSTVNSARTSSGAPGGASYFGAYSVSGGKNTTMYGTVSSYKEVVGNLNGTNGGSGGRAGDAGGASDGDPRSFGGINHSYATLGQGTTTRAFGLASGTLFSGAGGGGYIENKTSLRCGPGGAGGGGRGGGFSSSSLYANAVAGTPNTGGGGGGYRSAYVSSPANPVSGAGGSGIVIVRWGY